MCGYITKYSGRIDNNIVEIRKLMTRIDNGEGITSRTHEYPKEWTADLILGVLVFTEKGVLKGVQGFDSKNVRRRVVVK